MSKQYMTIQFGENTATIKTKSDKAIKMAIKKIYDMIDEGSVKTIEVNGNVIRFTYTTEKQFWGYWQPTRTGQVRIIENTFEVEAPAAEVIEAPAAEVIEAPAHTVTMSLEEKRAAWDIFVSEWAKSRAAYLKGEVELR